MTEKLKNELAKQEDARLNAESIKRENREPKVYPKRKKKIA